MIAAVLTRWPLSEHLDQAPTAALAQVRGVGCVLKRRSSTLSAAAGEEGGRRAKRCLTLQASSLG